MKQTRDWHSENRWLTSWSVISNKDEKLKSKWYHPNQIVINDESIIAASDAPLKSETINIK